MPSSKEYLHIFLDIGNALLESGAEIFRGIAENAFPLICHIAVTPVIQWSRRLRPRQTCQDGNS